MSENAEFNPSLPISFQFTPPKEGGNGTIHKPGHYQNVVWQTRSREPEAFELTLIAALEQLFEQGVETLPELVDALNSRQVYDRHGEAWQESSFREFMQVNGY